MNLYLRATRIAYTRPRWLRMSSRRSTYMLSVIPGCSLDRSSRVVGPTASYYTNCLKRQLSMTPQIRWLGSGCLTDLITTGLDSRVVWALNKRSPKGPSHGWTWALCPFKSVGSFERRCYRLVDDDFRVPSETRFMSRCHGHGERSARTRSNKDTLLCTPWPRRERSTRCPISDSLAEASSPTRVSTQCVHRTLLVCTHSPVDLVG